MSSHGRPLLVKPAHRFGSKTFGPWNRRHTLGKRSSSRGLRNFAQSLKYPAKSPGAPCGASNDLLFGHIQTLRLISTVSVVLCRRHAQANIQEVRISNQEATPRDGKLACRTGFGLMQNPFPAGSQEGTRWNDEWLEKSRKSDPSKMKSDHGVQSSPQSPGGGPQS